MYRVEAWTFEGDEEGCDDEELYEAATFKKAESAKDWAWERMEEGFQCRMWRE